MKKYLFMLSAAAMLAACQSREEKLRDFLPGTYTRSVSGQYSVANDTLVIRRVSGPNYTISRRTGFSRIRQGIQQPAELSREVLYAIWDPQQEVLLETAKGRRLRFSPDSALLRVGNKGVYRKIRERSGL